MGWVALQLPASLRHEDEPVNASIGKVMNDPIRFERKAAIRSPWTAAPLYGMAALYALACGTGNDTPFSSDGLYGNGQGGSSLSGTPSGNSGTGSSGDMPNGATGGMTDPCAGVACDPGSLCDEGLCIPGCNDQKPCASGSSCCDGGCYDLKTDINFCGSCSKACPLAANQAVTCEAGMCTLGACSNGFFDCDGKSQNGCESASVCICIPGAMQACYPGPANTENVGLCKPGTRKCNPSGTAFGLCKDFVTPSTELCANNIDEDCSGKADDVPDIDGDGWTVCNNDCCETTQDCAKPTKVNPGAFEFVGNAIDDDCDPATLDSVPAAACSSVAKFDGTKAIELVQALDLCQQTTANAPLAMKKWGVLSAEFVNADGSAPTAAGLANMEGIQSAVLANYGTGGVAPQKGLTMAGISSGRMRDANDSGYGAPNSGLSLGRYGNPPGPYLAAHGGKLPSSASCNGNCASGSGANDSVNLRVSIRVPTNALSFSYQFRFFSAEYWSFACTSFNDFYLALLTSKANGLPADKNISFDSLKNPVSVNNGFFDVCVAKGCYTCPGGSAPLKGTGMEIGNTGGATVWLKTTAPVVSGETMQLELMVFDVTDASYDSLSLLDGFEWSIDPSGVGTGPPG